MLSDEEKEEYIEHEILDRLYCLEENDFDKNKVDDSYIKAVLNACKEAKNLIEKQSKEIEHQIEKRANQRQELAILNAKQIEFNKLVNTVNSYKGQFKKQQKEIEELKERYERANKRYLKSLQEKDDKCEKLLEYVETEKETEYISKDKIKAKIEEIDKEIKVKREIAKNPMDRVSGRLLTDSIVELEKTKKVLQSLLEKE